MSRPEKTQDDYLREVEDRCNDLESRLEKAEVVIAILQRALGWKLDPDGLNLINVVGHSFRANWVTLEDVDNSERKILES